PSVVTFAQLPEEEVTFLAYLTKTGDIWARAVNDEPMAPRHEPAPVAEFMKSHAAKLSRNGVVDVYLGLRPDVLRPSVSETEERARVDIFSSCLIGYRGGEYYPSGELAQSNLFYYRGFFQGDEFVVKPEAFLRWASRVLGWAKRQTPKRVPVHRCNYVTR